MPKNSVCWNSGEKLKIVNALFAKYPDGLLPISITKAVNEAQEVLPTVRHRHLKGPSQFLDLVAIIKNRQVEAEAHRAPPLFVDELAEPPAEQPPLAPPPTPGHVEEWGEPIAALPAIDFVAMRATLSDMLSDLVAGVLVDSVKKLLTNGEIAAMLRSLQNGVLPAAIVEDRPKHSPLPDSVSRIGKPSYLLCGFKPHQQSAFLHSFPEFHLKFWYAERPNEGLESLKEKARNADAVLLTMEATSHSAVAMAQTVQRRIIRVTGGTTAMLAALGKLREEQVKKVG